MEQLMNHGSLLVRISLDQRLQRKEWLVPHKVEHSRSYHGPKPCTRVRPDTGFGGELFKLRGKQSYGCVLLTGGTSSLISL